MLHQVTVTSPPHVRAHFHLLAHFDLRGDPAGCYNPGYVRAISAARPASTPSPLQDFGRFHSCFRRARVQDALPLLPVPFESETAYHAVLDSLMGRADPPRDLHSGVRRLLGELANPAGRALVELFNGLVMRERQAFLNGHYRRSTPPGEGVASYLKRRLLPLVDALFGGAAQHVQVFLCEPLVTHAFAFSPEVGRHHIAAPAPPRLAFMHALLALVRKKTDPLVRKNLPVGFPTSPRDGRNRQLRIDVAITTTYHLLMRHAKDELTAFAEFAGIQFRRSGHLPAAAIEALHPMALIPPSAIPAIRQLLGDELHGD